MIPLPQFLGSKSVHIRRLLILRDASQIQPGFAIAALNRQEYDKYFDYRDYNKTQSIAIAKAMSNWGWMPNNWGGEWITDYYSLIRTLQFRWTLSKLRVAMLNHVNELLPRLGINCGVSFNGLLARDTIETTIKRLEAGSIGFPEAMEATRDE